MYSNIQPTVHPHTTWMMNRITHMYNKYMCIYTMYTMYIYSVYDMNLKVARQLSMAACARAYNAPEPG